MPRLEAYALLMSSLKICFCLEIKKKKLILFLLFYFILFFFFLLKRSILSEIMLQYQLIFLYADNLDLQADLGLHMV